MNEDRDVSEYSRDDAGDFEYDSAHEATAGRQVQAGSPRSVQVDPQPDSGDGDYGYDMAHDMGR